MPWAPDGPYWNLRGNGGLISTPDDLYRWFKTLMKIEISNAESTKAMFSNQTTDDSDAWYGYGWHIIEDDKGTWIDHSGSDGYKFTDIRYFKDHDLLLIFTTNKFDYDEVRIFLQSIYEIFELTEME